MQTKKTLRARAELTYGLLAECRAKVIDALLVKLDAARHADTYRAGGRPYHYAEPEFTGKYLDLVMTVARKSGSEQALENGRAVFESILRNQREDGYLGCLDPGRELDYFSVWNQSFTILGLLSCHAATKDVRALDAAVRCADYVMSLFMEGGRDILDAPNHGTQHISMLLPLCRLYAETGLEKLADYILHIVNRMKGSDLDFFAFDDMLSLRSKKGIENFVILLGMIEYGRLFDDPSALSGVTRYWEQVNARQIRNTGNGTLAERWTEGGNTAMEVSAEQAPNETCVAVGWIELSLALFHIYREPKYLDAIEKTLYNHMLASISEDGCDFAYYQPNFGKRIRATGERSYKCCRYRGLTLFTYMDEMLVYEDVERLIPMLYTSCRYESEGATLSIETGYPHHPTVTLDIMPKRDKTLLLRIPAGCRLLTLSLSGKELAVSEEQGYLRIPLSAGRGEHIVLTLANELRFEYGTINGERRIALTYGPLLLAANNVSKRACLTAPPRLHALPPHGGHMLLFKTKRAECGASLSFSEYASADNYRIWLPIGEGGDLT